MQSPSYQLDADDRTELLNALDADTDGDRAHALRVLDQHDELPVREPNSNRNAWIADVEVTSSHAESHVVKEITRVVELHDGDECDECGYDRAKVHWCSTMAGDFAETKTCNLCENEMRHRSTL